MSYVYKVILEPANLPVDLDTLQAHLRLDDTTWAAELDLMNVYIKAVADYAEKYTGRTLITTGFRTYRNTFNYHIVLRRAIGQQIDKIEYLKSDAWTLIDSAGYYLEISNSYPQILSKDGIYWPQDLDNIEQGIKIEFTAGYGDTYEDMPDALVTALMNHIANLYVNRGDCGTMDSVEALLPAFVKMTYDFYKIRELNGTVC